MLVATVERLKDEVVESPLHMMSITLPHTDQLSQHTYNKTLSAAAPEVRRCQNGRQTLRKTNAPHRSSQESMRPDIPTTTHALGISSTTMYIPIAQMPPLVVSPGIETPD